MLCFAGALVDYRLRVLFVYFSLRGIQMVVYDDDVLVFLHSLSKDVADLYLIIYF